MQLRLPLLFNLRSDLFERAHHESGDSARCFAEHAFELVLALVSGLSCCPLTQ
jgi:arylsulfatase